MADRPIIGIPCPRRSLPEGSPPRYGVPATYVDAIAGAGGVPLVVPAVGSEGAGDALLQGIDGLCFPGGGDIDPSHYGEDPSADLRAVDPELDRFELRWVRRAAALSLPVIGICRGHQVVNVALGGTLVQHLPPASHEPAEAVERQAPSHVIAIEPASRLHGLVGTGSLAVNSFHHQAVAQVAPMLRVVARSADGVVEALESADGVILTLQCHPEAMTGEVWAANVFRDLVRRATAFRRARDGGRRPAPATGRGDPVERGPASSPRPDPGRPILRATTPPGSH